MNVYNTRGMKTSARYNNFGGGFGANQWGPWGAQPA